VLCVNVNVSVKTFTQAAPSVKEFESEALTAEEMLGCVVCSREQFRFQMSIESGDSIAELFVNGAYTA